MVYPKPFEEWIFAEVTNATSINKTENNTREREEKIRATSQRKFTQVLQ